MNGWISAFVWLPYFDKGTKSQNGVFEKNPKNFSVLGRTIIEGKITEKYNQTIKTNVKIVLVQLKMRI